MLDGDIVGVAALVLFTDGVTGVLTLYFSTHVFQHSSSVMMFDSKLTTDKLHLTSSNHSFSAWLTLDNCNPVAPHQDLFVNVLSSLNLFAKTRLTTK